VAVRPKLIAELKARYEDHGKARALLAGAEPVGTFEQLDTYFALGARRLKIRSVRNRVEGQLIFYERPDGAEVKDSRVLIADLPDAGIVLEILRNVFPVQAEVRKTREIHRYQGVQIHLDTVAELGRFIEFEKTFDSPIEAAEAHRHVESLRVYFQIPDEDLMESSYSDLVETGR